MPTEYNSDDMTIGQLLSMTSPAIVVPEWQRNYSWDTTEVEAFWQDLVSFSDQYPEDNIHDHQYFLGSIVLVATGTQHLLLDGQQRLGTATILISVIRDYLRPFRESAAVRTSHNYISQYDDVTEENQFKLTLNRYDRDYFRQQIQQDSPAGPGPTPSLESHELIKRAQAFFKTHFAEAYQRLGQGKEAFDWALRIQDVLTNHMSVVAVTSTDEDNAANVFEVLNDRGIGLSTSDLLRNLVLRRSNASDADEVIDCWETVLELDQVADVEDFLRHYWLSYKGDVKTRGLYREIKQNILGEERDSLDLSRDLRRTANDYRDLVTGRDPDPAVQRQLESVNLLGAKLLRPAILSAYSVASDPDKRRLLSALITLYVRHNVIGHLENSRLETVVFDIAKRLREDADVDAAIENARQLAPPDDRFVQQFQQA